MKAPGLNWPNPRAQKLGRGKQTEGGIAIRRTFVPLSHCRSGNQPDPAPWQPKKKRMPSGGGGAPGPEDRGLEAGLRTAGSPGGAARGTHAPPPGEKILGKMLQWVCHRARMHGKSRIKYGHAECPGSRRFGLMIQCLRGFLEKRRFSLGCWDAWRSFERRGVEHCIGERVPLRSRGDGGEGRRRPAPRCPSMGRGGC